MDGAYQRLSPAGKRIYRVLGRESYLAKGSPRRRYVCITNQQLAEAAGCCKRTVQYEIKKMLISRLLIRWFAGCSGSPDHRPPGQPAPRPLGASAARSPQPPRYELPASLDQVVFWRI